MSLLIDLIFAEDFNIEKNKNYCIYSKVTLTQQGGIYEVALLCYLFCKL